MEIKILSCTDDMLEVWRISRPYVLDNDTTTSDDLLKMNLPINQFKVMTLYIKSSILFRDLLFTFRPVSEWARSNRTIKFTKDNIKISDDINKLGNSIESVQSDLDSVIERVSNGEKQDYVKKSLPLMTETEFCINVNYRTLMNILFTFENHFKKYFYIFIEELSRCKEFNKSDYDIATKTDLFYDVALTEDEFNLSYGSNKLGSINVIKVSITANLMAQFIRQHSSTIKNGLWNLVDTDPDTYLKSCEVVVPCVAILSDAKLRNLTSTRTCWFAQFDKEENSSWSYVLSDYVNKMTAKEFVKQLPCKCDPNSCKIFKDMLPRIQHTEVNPPCPILIENPYIIRQRLAQYGSNSAIFNKWMDAARESYIKYNPRNPYNTLYGSIEAEAGTNVKKEDK